MGTLCSSGAAIHKAGKNCHISGALLAEEFIQQAESFVSAQSRIDWSGAYAALNKDVKYILEDHVSCLAGMMIINWDMSGYTSRLEAQTMLDVLDERFKKTGDLLKEKIATDFIKAA